MNLQKKHKLESFQCDAKKFPAPVSSGTCNCLTTFQEEWNKLVQILQDTTSELNVYKKLYQEAIESVNKAKLTKVKIDQIFATIKESVKCFDEVTVLLNFDESKSSAELQNDINKITDQQICCTQQADARSIEDIKNDRISNKLPESAQHSGNAKGNKNTRKGIKTKKDSALPQKNIAKRKKIMPEVVAENRDVSEMETAFEDTVVITVKDKDVEQNLNLSGTSYSQNDAVKSNVGQVSINRPPPHFENATLNIISPEISSLSKKVIFSETLNTKKSSADGYKKMTESSKLKTNCRTSSKMNSLPKKIRRISKTSVFKKPNTNEGGEKMPKRLKLKTNFDVTKQITPKTSDENILNKASIFRDNSKTFETNHSLKSNNKTKNAYENSSSFHRHIKAKNQKRMRKMNSFVTLHNNIPVDDLSIRREMPRLSKEV